MYSFLRFKTAFFLAFLFSLNSIGQRFEHYSWSVYGQGSALSNYRTIPVQEKAYFSGGFDYGTSLTDEINLKAGFHYMQMYLFNDKQYHSVCDLPDNSCHIESEVNYLNFPIGVEFYSNTSRLQSKSYYILRLIPMLSVKSKQIKTEAYTTETNDFHFSVDTTLFSSIKFQDLHFEFGLGGDISLSDKLKLYFEPSIQHSIAFRKEDLMNPNYMISLRIGIRYRSVKRK